MPVSALLLQPNCSLRISRQRSTAAFPVHPRHATGRCPSAAAVQSRSFGAAPIPLPGGQAAGVRCVHHWRLACMAAKSVIHGRRCQPGAAASAFPRWQSSARKLECHSTCLPGRFRVGGVAIMHACAACFNLKSLTVVLAARQTMSVLGKAHVVHAVIRPAALLLPTQSPRGLL